MNVVIKVWTTLEIDKKTCKCLVSFLIWKHYVIYFSNFFKFIYLFIISNRGTITFHIASMIPNKTSVTVNTASETVPKEDMTSSYPMAGARLSTIRYSMPVILPMSRMLERLQIELQISNQPAQRAQHQLHL